MLFYHSFYLCKNIYSFFSAKQLYAIAGIDFVNLLFYIIKPKTELNTLSL